MKKAYNSPILLKRESDKLKLFRLKDESKISDGIMDLVTQVEQSSVETTGG